MGRSKTFFVTLVVALCLFSGCGGRSSGDDIVTTRSETSLDPDALLIAARSVQGYVVPIQAVRDRDSELRSARQAFPDLKEIHAAPSFNAYELHFAISNDAPWLSSWKAGKLATGVRDLDSVFEEFDANAVHFLNQDGDQSWFAVTFDTYLRANRAAGLFFGKSDFLRIASIVSAPSSTTDIYYETIAPSTTRLTFVVGEMSTVVERTGKGSWSKAVSVTPL
jgi:hypothetical protein